MNNQGIRRMLILHSQIRRFRRHIKSVSISPMRYAFGRYNWNLRVVITSTIYPELPDLLDPNAKELSYWQKKKNEIVNDYYFEKNFFKGDDGWQCSNDIEYLTAAETLANFITYIYPKLKVNIYYKDKVPINLQGIHSLKWISIEKKKKEYEKQLRSKFAGLEVLEWKIRRFLEKCDNSYDRVIIGKIRANTSLSSKEVEKYKGFKNAYKELLKIKSFIKPSSELIKI